LNEEDPDAELLARIDGREPGAVREMVARKLPRLLALATRMLGDRDEASDVAQEAFVRIWKQASRWQRGQARFDTWLHRVALNLCYDRLRRRQDVISDDDAPNPSTRRRCRKINSTSPRAASALPLRSPRCRHASARHWYCSTTRNCRTSRQRL
jgi:RNA polymerase sigma factor (sigma-70 family)